MTEQSGTLQTAAYERLDAFWKAAVDFVTPHLAAGDRLVAPMEFGACFPGHLCLAYDAVAPGDCAWVVLHKGMLQQVEAGGWWRVCLAMQPVFANEVFVIFAAGNRAALLAADDVHYQSFRSLLAEVTPVRAVEKATQNSAPAREIVIREKSTPAIPPHPAIYLGKHRALTTTVNGQKIYVDTRDTSVTPHLLLNGVWESWITEVYSRQIREGATVIEVGANAGYYTLLAGAKVGPRGKVIAFEANRDLSELLFHSIEINGFLERCEIVNKAVIDKAGEVTFRKLKNHWASGSIAKFEPEFLELYKDSAEEVTVGSVCLDDFIRERGLERVDVIKIDAEGSEPLIFKGLEETLDKATDLTVIFELAPVMINMVGGDAGEMLRGFMRKGFVLQRISTGGLVAGESVEELLAFGSCDILMRKQPAGSATPEPVKQTAHLQHELPLRPSEEDFQKISNAADLLHPLLQRIVREDFAWKGAASIASQRMWEFAMAYAALESLGFLQKDKVGLSFGAGVEVMLYAISNKVKMIHATDLYTPDSTWSEANTRDARKFVLDSATLPCTPDAIDVRNMDMRKADLPDASVDFCYSISAMEHIGDDADFVAHLREARRILKDDGIYFLTTTFIPAAATIPQPGTRMFTLEHLRDLFAEAGLHPCERFNAHISDDILNTPTFYRGTLAAPPYLQDTFVPFMYMQYGSEPMGACCFVLRKERQSAQGMQILGLEETKGKLEVLRLVFQNELWKAPVAVATDRHAHIFKSHPEFFCYTEALEFGDAEMEATFHFTCGKEMDAQVVLYVEHRPVEEPLNIAQSDHQYLRIQGKAGDVQRHVFSIRTKARHMHAFVARVENGGDIPTETHLWVQRKSGGGN